MSFPDAIESIQGMWYAKSARVDVNGSAIQGRPDVLFKKWDEWVSDRPNVKASPSFTVDISLFESDIHKTLTVTAFMPVNYPYNPYDGMNFTESSDMLKSTYQLFVVSPEDAIAKQAYDKWANERDVAANRVPILITGCVMAALSGGLIVLMIIMKNRKSERA